MAKQVVVGGFPPVWVSETTTNQTPIAGGQALSQTGTVSYSASLSDATVTVSDSFAGALGYGATLTDSAASSDAFGGGGPGASPLRDNVVTSDGFTIDSAYSFAQSDLVRSFDVWSGLTAGTGPIYQCGPIPIFPTLPQGFPIKVSPVLDTTIGTTKSLREMRAPQHTVPLWDIEILFEELRDKTQNQTPYTPFSAYTQYMQLVQLWLMMYGQTGVFGFDCPWDDSRTDQLIATGDGVTQNFPIVRTWGTGSLATTAPIGLVGSVFNVKLNGTVQGTGTYSTSRSYVNFVTAPPAGDSITISLTYYYLCRFVEDEQAFEEFSKNRWAVPSLKFRAVYWPGCQ